MSRVLLTYKDTSLFQEDVNLLLPGQWLNDKIINFYLDYLIETSKNSKLIEIIGPSVVFLIKEFCEDEESVKEILSPLNLEEKELIIVPINNNEDINVVGGSHWSLLVYEKENNKFKHYDSYDGLNSKHARKVAEKLQLFFPNSGYGEEKAPQQKNGYDCGVYLLAYAYYVLHIYKSNEAPEAINSFITPANVTQLREKILHTINQLMANK